VRRAWLIAAGGGVRVGARAGGRMIDVAPTLAALVGVAAPADAQGRTLVEALDVDARTAAALEADDGARIARATEAAVVGLRGLRIDETRRRVLRSLALLGGLFLIFVYLRRAGRPARFGLLVGLASLVCTAGVWAVWYGRLSFSADRDTSHLAVGSGVLATGAALIAFAPAFWAAARGTLTPGPACTVSLAALLGASPIALAVFAYAGAFAPRVTCEPGWLAMLPLVTYCALAPVIFLGALLITTSSIAASTREMLAALALSSGRGSRRT
jgi:hypothetical protein